MNISVTILVKDSPRHLREVLNALQEFEEVLIYDNGACPDAVALCQSFSNVHRIEGAFLGFGPTHNLASQAARFDWILSIDSDEVVTPDLREEIRHLALDPSSIYSFPRHNEFNGKWIRWCGWFPDRVIRLYHRRFTKFSEALVHEGVETVGCKPVELSAPLRHYSYDSLSDFLTKMQIYSDLFAKQYVGKKRSSPLKALLHGMAAFIKSFFIKRGFLGGYEGFLISIYNGHTAFYKYLKLYEANQVFKESGNLSEFKMRRCPAEKAKRDISSGSTQK